MEHVRTPKAGETWIWKECHKHQFKQLRDVVWCGCDFEDHPPHIQEYLMPFYICGCQYAADDPEGAIRALRIDEELYKSRMMREAALIVAEANEPTGAGFPWVLLWLLSIAVALYFAVH